jgi:hypothetical protein
MDDQAFDSLTRRTAEAVSRRGSMLTLGAAALAAGFAGTGVTKAKKKNKKNKNKCPGQVEECRTGLANVCAQFFDNEGSGFSLDECITEFGPCCEFLQGCDAAAGFQCAVDKIVELSKK